MLATPNRVIMCYLFMKVLKGEKYGCPIKKKLFMVTTTGKSKCMEDRRCLLGRYFKEYVNAFTLF